mmetsp:Transcript_12472/g.25905  ORF Transcript_12472/g.25905 Transcript_12472/m.25905 type:complete len:165 (-) Transcript_12472:216-710(-)
MVRFLSIALFVACTALLSFPTYAIEDKKFERLMRQGAGGGKRRDGGGGSRDGGGKVEEIQGNFRAKQAAFATAMKENPEIKEAFTNMKKTNKRMMQHMLSVDKETRKELQKKQREMMKSGNSGGKRGGNAWGDMSADQILEMLNKQSEQNIEMMKHMGIDHDEL